MPVPGAAALVGTAMKPYPLGSSLVPQLAILLGCLGWAVGTAYLRNVETHLGLLTFTGLQMFIGGLMLFVPATLAGDFAAWHWSPAGVGALFYLMVFNSLLAYTAYAWLSKHATPGQIGSYGLVNPAVATLLGWLVLDERLSVAQWIGTIVILAGVLMVTWPRAARSESRRQRRRPKHRSKASGDISSRHQDRHGDRDANRPEPRRRAPAGGGAARHSRRDAALDP